MRTFRISLTGMVVLALVGVLSVTTVARSDDAEAMEPPAEFSGRISCPVATDWHQATVTDVVLGPLSDGDLIRREARGGFFGPVVDEMSDPRLEGVWSVYLDLDEYLYPGVDRQEHVVLMTGLQRIENSAGAWQGSAPSAFVPDAPLTRWELVVLVGEGAYEGLTALQWTNVVDDTCSCGDAENLCAWDIRGLVFEGQMPPIPSVNQDRAWVRFG